MSTKPNNSASQTLISETQLTEQIISLYREHPELWQVSHKLYKNRYQRDEGLRDIGAKVNLPASDVKARIYKLRSQFSAERRKLLTRKTGSGADDFRRQTGNGSLLSNFLAIGFNSEPRNLICL